MSVEDLHVYAGAAVRVCLADGSQWSGILRTELLSPRSLSVFIQSDGDGATLYIDEITEIVRVTAVRMA